MDTLLVWEPGDLLSDLSGIRSWEGPCGEGEEPKPMMHGQEKSDSLVVAEKSTNNPAQGGAESMEPRRGAKGNGKTSRISRPQGRKRNDPATTDRALLDRKQSTAWRFQRSDSVITQGRSPVRKLRSLGSVRGAPRKGRPYRDGTQLRWWVQIKSIRSLAHSQQIDKFQSLEKEIQAAKQQAPLLKGYK